MPGQPPAVPALNRSKQALQTGPDPPAQRDLLDQRVEPDRPFDSLIRRDHIYALHGRSDYH
jgi:hypothetical protein